MITRRKADAQRAAAAAAAALAASSSSSTGASAAASSQIIANAAAVMTDGDGHTDNAAPAASQAATATEPLASAVTASALTGHKRAAVSRDSSSAATASAAAPPSLSSDSQQQANASEQSQNKKQRGESSSQGGSSAAAASSVGFESLSSAPTAAASSSFSPVGVLSGGFNAVQSARSVVADDDAKKSQSATASASASSSSESSPAPLDSGQQELQRICEEAQRLIRGALPLADAEVHRWNPATAAAVKSKMQELAAAEAELQSIPADGTTEEETNQRGVKARIEGLTEWLKIHGGLPYAALHVINKSRTVTQQPAAPIAVRQLGSLCSLLSLTTGKLPPLPPAQKEVLACWRLRVDALFARLCSVLQRVKLSRQQSDEFADAAFLAGTLQLIPALWVNVRSEQTGLGEFLLNQCCRLDDHCVCLEPYLRLFEYGLDPTTDPVGNPLSALQLARNFVCDHPLPADVHAADPTAEMQTALQECRELDVGTVPSLLAAFAIHQWRLLGGAETQRRADLHARFMHAFIPAWLAHSTKVRALLLDAAPDRLIPPLVDLVSRCLDLEGVPPERVAPVEEKAEMED